MKIILIIIIFFYSSILYSDQNDSKLDTLFESLQNKEFTKDHDNIIRDIWQSWSSIDNKEAQKIMDSLPLYFSSQRYEEAIELLNVMIVKFPDYSEAYNKRATLYFIMGNYDLSLMDIKNTLSLEPRHFGALDGMARILINYEKYDEAIKVYNEMKLLMPFDKMIDLKIEKVKKLKSITT